MPHPTDPKGVERVRKLLALARNNPSVEEAAVAFARAQELAARLQLDLDDTSGPPEAPDADRPVEQIDDLELDTFARAPAWLVELAEAVAHANRCGFYWRSGQRGGHAGGVYCYGQPSDMAAVAYMYQAIKREVDRLARHAARGKGRSWGRNFRLGAVEEIGHRLQQARRRAVASAKSEAFEQGGETALVRVDRALEHDQQVRDAVGIYRDEYLNLVPATGFAGAGAYGYDAGRRAGRTVTLGGGRALKPSAPALEGSD